MCYVLLPYVCIPVAQGLACRRTFMAVYCEQRAVRAVRVEGQALLY
jgi:hypothetical protein